MSARTSARSGGRLPAPSQVTNRMLAPWFIFRSAFGVGSRLGIYDTRFDRSSFDESCAHPELRRRAIESAYRMAPAIQESNLIDRLAADGAERSLRVTHRDERGEVNRGWNVE